MRKQKNNMIHNDTPKSVMVISAGGVYNGVCAADTGQRAVKRFAGIYKAKSGL